MMSTCIKKDGYDIAVVGLDELLAKVVVVLGSTYTFYILPKKSYCLRRERCERYS
jgi:hypothetical protein